MTSLPTGTVTFLFTDIEGSTELVQRLGDRRYALFAERRPKRKGLISAHGGLNGKFADLDGYLPLHCGIAWHWVRGGWGRKGS